MLSVCSWDGELSAPTSPRGMYTESLSARIALLVYFVAGHINVTLSALMFHSPLFTKAYCGFHIACTTSFGFAVSSKSMFPVEPVVSWSWRRREWGQTQGKRNFLKDLQNYSPDVTHTGLAVAVLLDPSICQAQPAPVRLLPCWSELRLAGVLNTRRALCSGLLYKLSSKMLMYPSQLSSGASPLCTQQVDVNWHVNVPTASAVLALRTLKFTLCFGFCTTRGVFPELIINKLLELAQHTLSSLFCSSSYWSQYSGVVLRSTSKYKLQMATYSED